MRPLDSLPGWSRDPLVRLGEIRIGKDELDIIADHAVAEAREAGHPWQTIADELGVSKQWAWQRWHDA